MLLTIRVQPWSHLVQVICLCEVITMIELYFVPVNHTECLDQTESLHCTGFLSCDLTTKARKANREILWILLVGVSLEPYYLARSIASSRKLRSASRLWPMTTIMQVDSCCFSICCLIFRTTLKGHGCALLEIEVTIQLGAASKWYCDRSCCVLDWRTDLVRSPAWMRELATASETSNFSWPGSTPLREWPTSASCVALNLHPTSPYTIWSFMMSAKKNATPSSRKAPKAAVNCKAFSTLTTEAQCSLKACLWSDLWYDLAQLAAAAGLAKTSQDSPAW